LIAAELDAVLGQALTMAESAMLEARLDDTDAALQRVETVDPQNVRLPFLKAQLSQMLLRERLDEARTAIRDNRFEDAGTALSAARQLDVSDTTEIEAVVAELNSARSAQQVDDVLAKAAARLESGDLLSPSNDNARYYYELVLSNDVDNTAARQGLSVIAGKLAFQARTEIDNGDLSLAEDTLANARAIDPANSEVAASATALANERTNLADQQRRNDAERQARADRQAEAERQAEADRLAAERQAEADRQAAANSVAEQPTVTDEAGSTTNETAAKTVTTMALAEDATSAGSAEKFESVVGSTAADNSSQDETPVQTQEPAKTEIVQQPTAVSSLNRIKYVAPKYPRSAQRRNLSGWVDIVFTVTTDGTVKDIDVRKAEPDETFINSAVKAVEKWEFEPVVENGAIVEKRAGVRMMFALE